MKVEVTVYNDSNGILNNKGLLSKEYSAKMVSDAEKPKAEDGAANKRSSCETRSKTKNTPHITLQEKNV